MRKIQKCGKQSLYNGDFFLSYLKEKYFKVLRIFVVNFKCFFFYYRRCESSTNLLRCKSYNLQNLLET